MLELYINENTQSLDVKSIGLLNAALHVFLDNTIKPFSDDDIHWTVDKLHSLNGDGFYYNISGTIDDRLTVTPVVTWSSIDTCRLTDIQVDGAELTKLKSFPVTPINEVYILATLEAHEPTPRLLNRKEAHSQLSAYSKLVQAMYQDDPDYDPNLPVPKTFFTKLDFDVYMSNLSVTLQESILLWMESTGRLSVNMNDTDINVQPLANAKYNIKRIYMSGPARNKITIEFEDNSTTDFGNLTTSLQVELCNEILSILPEV